LPQWPALRRAPVTPPACTGPGCPQLAELRAAHEAVLGEERRRATEAQRLAAQSAAEAEALERRAVRAAEARVKQDDRRWAQQDPHRAVQEESDECSWGWHGCVGGCGWQRMARQLGALRAARAEVTEGVWGACACRVAQLTSQVQELEAAVRSLRRDRGALMAALRSVPLSPTHLGSDHAHEEGGEGHWPAARVDCAGGQRAAAGVRERDGNEPCVRAQSVQLRKELDGRAKPRAGLVTGILRGDGPR
jgi:hypothetical protein